MMQPEWLIFAEVADFLNITDPAIVENDDFLLQLLRLLSNTLELGGSGDKANKR